MSTREGFSIGELAEQTGVKPVTLRAWERRYGLLCPVRQDSGHRVYSRADLARVREVVSWLQQGVAIGQVSGLLRGSGQKETGLQAPVVELVDSALHFRQHKLDQQLGRHLAEQPLQLFVREILFPARQRLRDVGGDGVAALALLDGVLQHKLGAQILKQTRRIRRQSAWLVISAGSDESLLTARIYALALLESGAEVLFLPRAVTRTSVQSLLQSRRAGRVLLVACPATRAADWRRLTPPQAPAPGWLITGGPVGTRISQGLKRVAGAPWEVIETLLTEAGQ